MPADLPRRGFIAPRGVASSRTPGTSRSLAPALVWGDWAALTVALFAYLVTFTRDFPWWDEWELIPLLSGEQPFRAAWLWEQHNEHRIVLPKVVHLASAALTGADLRGPTFVSAALLALAAALIAAARQARGRTSLTDLFFPLVLLHWGHFDNLLWGFQIQFAGSTALLALLIAAVVSRRLVAAGVCLAALPLFGANGVALVPALSLWLLYVAVARRGRGSVPPAAFALLALGLSALTFVGYVRPADIAPPPGLSAAVMPTFWVLTMTECPSGIISGGWALGTVILIAIFARAGLFAPALARPAQERWRGVGLLAAMAGVVSLALAIGYGRAGAYAPRAVSAVSRYSLLMAPLAIAAYGTCLVRESRWLPAFLFGAALLVFPVNTAAGLKAGRERSAFFDRLADEARGGMTGGRFAEKYRRNLYGYGKAEVFAERYEMMRRARLGPFRDAPH